MKKILIIAAIAIPAILLIGYGILKYMTNKAERHVELETGIPIDAAELVKQFQANETDANSKYLDKTLQVTGIVISADSNETKQSVILLQGDSSSGVICTFKQYFPNIQPGDKLICKGICTGFLSNVTLKDCILIGLTKAIAFTKPVIKKDSIAVPKKDTTTEKVLKFMTTRAKLSFDAGGGVEAIKASNNQGEARISSDGRISFKVPILGFKFSDALMQQHFNEDYLESQKFPTAGFSGNIDNVGTVNFDKDGKYAVTVSGTLTMHGVSNKIKTPASLEIKGGKLQASSILSIKLSDYKIATDAASAAVISISANF